MRILFIGGPTAGVYSFDWPELCRWLGRVIGASEHSLVVCSSYARGADRYVFDGFAAAGGTKERLFVYHPANPLSVSEDWRELLESHHFGEALRQAVPGPNAIEAETRSNAYLLAQIAAIQECDIVVAVGGRDGGSATISLAIALSRNVPVVPFAFAGGAAAEVWKARHQALASTLLREHMTALSVPSGLSSFLEIARAMRNPSLRQNKYVFISHSWCRPADTDLVEMELLRHNISAFRDERNVQPGEDVQVEIQNALARCTHFIGLWSTEYACSPNCYDEFHSIVERSITDDSLKILMLRFDDTRLVWSALRSGTRNWPRIESREQLRESIRRFIGHVSHLD